jgi:hypothetical protein
MVSKSVAFDTFDLNFGCHCIVACQTAEVAVLPARGTFLAPFLSSQLGDKIFSYVEYDFWSNSDIEINNLSRERSHSQIVSPEISTYSMYQVPTNIMFLVIIHCLVFILKRPLHFSKRNVSDTGFCRLSPEIGTSSNRLGPTE